MNYYFCVHTIGFENLEGLVPKMPSRVLLELAPVRVLVHFKKRT